MKKWIPKKQTREILFSDVQLFQPEHRITLPPDNSLSFYENELKLIKMVWHVLISKSSGVGCRIVVAISSTSALVWMCQRYVVDNPPLISNMRQETIWLEERIQGLTKLHCKELPRLRPSSSMSPRWPDVICRPGGGCILSLPEHRAMHLHN